jgi:hypothetical protein
VSLWYSGDMMYEEKGEPLNCEVGNIVLGKSTLDPNRYYYWFVYNVEPIKYRYNFKTYNINRIHCWDIADPENRLTGQIFHKTMGSWTYEIV